jgi:hypothetical protein
VEAQDWDPIPECGKGLHGWLWGEGNHIVCDWWDDPKAKWLVAAVWEADLIDLTQKVKFPRAYVVFCGERHEAASKIIQLGATGPVMFCTKTGGNGSILTGGAGSILTGNNYSTLTGGRNSKLNGGYYSILKGGVCSILTGGTGSTLTGGTDSTLTSGRNSTLNGGDGSILNGDKWSYLTGGEGSILTGGEGSILTGGEGSIFIFRIWHDNRYRLHVAYVGENGIEPNKPHKLKDKNIFPC